jgi:NAD(P)H-dependent FMN reductase
VKILAISGSLQRSSANTEILQVALDVAPSPIDVVLFVGIGEIPPYNPDLDDDRAPESASAFRTLVHHADAVVIATPEYAHGMPGTLKNALDWLVGSGELYDKPVVVVSAVSVPERGQYARDSLVQTLEAQGAVVLASRPVLIPPPPHDTERLRALAIEQMRDVLALFQLVD